MVIRPVPSFADSQTDYQSVLRHNRKTDWQSVSHEAWEVFAREQMRRVEKWLDQGMGACWLKQPNAATMVSDALHHFDLDTYELGCFVIMPNHVHAIIRPLRADEQPLEKILQFRKRRTAKEINQALRLSGKLWQEESFDRIIRDEDLYRCVQYIGSNARRAGISLGLVPRWIRPDWEELGWRFEDSE